jgi:steroid delta-isomerase-like uncharacterized protein
MTPRGRPASRAPPEFDGTNGSLLPLRSFRPLGVLANSYQEDVMAPATAVSPQVLTDIAKVLIQAYNDRDWARAKATMTPEFVYDEVPTARKVTGADASIELWKGWARAFPDSKGTIKGTHVAEGGTVVLEVTWAGSHQGELQTPKGPIPPTGKRIEVRACAIVEVAGDKARTQRHYFDMATLLQQIGLMA